MNLHRKKQLKRLLDRAGLAIRPARHARPLDLTREVWEHPMDLLYQSIARPILLKVPLSRCLSFGVTAFPANADGASPFYWTLRALKHGECSRYEGSPLEQFYTLYQPHTAAELLDVPESVPSLFHALPPCGAPFVWHHCHPSDLPEQRLKEIAEDHAEHGIKLAPTDGDPFFGPVTPAKGQVEFQRLTRIYESLFRDGQRVDPVGIHNIAAVCLQKEGDWRFLLAGQHRVAALAALDRKEIILQLQTHEYGGGLIRREDACHWSLVRAGIIPLEQAEQIFDRMIGGRQPACAKKWLHTVRSQHKFWSAR